MNKTSDVVALAAMLLFSVEPSMAYKPGEYPGDPKIQPWNVKRWEKACKYMNEGNKLLDSQEPHKAGRAYLNARLLYPWDFRFYANMGLYWSKSSGRKGDSVERDYQKAICLCPDEWRNWNALANEYYRQGQLNEARPLLQQALSLNPPKEISAKLKANLAQIEAELISGKTGGSGKFKQQVVAQLWAQDEQPVRVGMAKQ